MVTKGAVDELLRRVDKIETSDGIHPITEEDRKLILDTNEHFSQKGLRVLAFATKPIQNPALCMEDEKKLTYLGRVAMIEEKRQKRR